MNIITVDDFFFETLYLGEVCLGSVKQTHRLVSTPQGDFEVWDGSQCVAGESFSGPSRIRLGNSILFERDGERFTQANYGDYFRSMGSL